MPRRHRTVCAEPNCPTITDHTRCLLHARVHDHQRGTTYQRGYDRNHVQLRKRWAPQVDAGRVACWRCLQPIQPGSVWHLGHDDDDRTIHRGPEHELCNLGANGHRNAPRMSE